MRGQIMECFECSVKKFELDTLRDREPIEFLKDRGDVFMGAGVGEEAGFGRTVFF